MRACLGDDDLIRVGVDYEICIVSNHDHLALSLSLSEQRDQFVEDRLWVQVFLWLVNDQGTIIGVIERKIEE